MIVQVDGQRYARIVHIPRPEPKRHTRMPRQKRAAQFAPFAALTGYDKFVKAANQAQEDKIEKWERGAVEDGFWCDDSQ